MFDWFTSRVEEVFAWIETIESNITEITDDIAYFKSEILYFTDEILYFKNEILYFIEFAHTMRAWLIGFTIALGVLILISIIQFIIVIRTKKQIAELEKLIKELG